MVSTQQESVQQQSDAQQLQDDPFIRLDMGFADIARDQFTEHGTTRQDRRPVKTYYENGETFYVVIGVNKMS